MRPAASQESGVIEAGVWGRGGAVAECNGWHERMCTIPGMNACAQRNRLARAKYDRIIQWRAILVAWNV